ncbi:hypothetical protein K435DRAFT_813044 [Dendrothele bispora CBS 962.96]|uniref:Uncharacterized protein n=1 Tax=Dendrothele bispora (strain CBS 962.96) TaxID=1314807 RepID=A0A4S8KMS4_DENBC|nr:hypothetical protein K435DRAFT_813044 [Dendrothele bispora CBS 962.96]
MPPHWSELQSLPPQYLMDPRYTKELQIKNWSHNLGQSYTTPSFKLQHISSTGISDLSPSETEQLIQESVLVSANKSSTNTPYSQTYSSAPLDEANSYFECRQGKTNWRGSGTSSTLNSAPEATTNSSYHNNLTREEISSYGHSNVDYKNHIEDDELDYFLDSEDMEEVNNEPDINDGTNYGSILEDSTRNSGEDSEGLADESKYEDLDLEEQDYGSDGEYGDDDNTEGIEGYDEIAEYF